MVLLKFLSIVVNKAAIVDFFYVTREALYLIKAKAATILFKTQNKPKLTPILVYNIYDDLEGFGKRYIVF